MQWTTDNFRIMLATLSVPISHKNTHFSSDTGAPVLAKLPLDPVIGKSCDEGDNIFSDETLSDSKVVTAYSELTEKIMKIIQ